MEISPTRNERDLTVCWAWLGTGRELKAKNTIHIIANKMRRWHIVGIIVRL